MLLRSVFPGSALADLDDAAAHFNQNRQVILFFRLPLIKERLMQISTIPVGPIQSNSYLLTEGSEAVLIDCGAAEPALLEALNGLKLYAVLFTHGHWDHILGAAEIKKRTGAKIAIHPLDAQRLTNPAFSGAGRHGLGQTPLCADVLPEGGDELSFGKILLRAIHTPGHTQGGVCYLHEKTRSLFTGDTLFKGDCGRVDMPGGDWDSMLCSLRSLRDLPGDYSVYPGHGPSTTMAKERAGNRYL
jgi:glyoxylase-like metal-dependent hydrolase (beta-lactamase superfamily II)